MDSLRKWFYRPKKDDTSLLAQFFFADEALNMIVSELDSFDGRKDPERCTALVNQLRQSQDKVLTITNSIMDALIGDERANRSFRVKFPEDVLQENLAGQLWFGAECLAAGSSIMNRESESSAMRPLAIALTKSLETVRNLLREICLTRNTPNGPLKLNRDEFVTDVLIQTLKIFDRHFAEFELCYVSTMVPVKTAQEFELQELISVLFSETLQRALKMQLVTQEMVEDCDPALMFTIPRLAIVSGLLVFTEGPLCIDKPIEEMSEMFRPFRVLLLRIRDLLLTLESNELFTLEKLLCDNEQEAHVVLLETASKAFAEEFYEKFVGTKDLVVASAFNNCFNNNNNNISNEADNNSKSECEVQVQDRSANTNIPSTSATATTATTLKRADSLPDPDSFQIISNAAATLNSILNTKDESQLESSPNDSGVCTENTSLDRSPSLESNCQCCAATGKVCRCLEGKGAAAATAAAEKRSSGAKKHHPSTSKAGKKSSKRPLVSAVVNATSATNNEANNDDNHHDDDDALSVGSTDTTSSFSSACGDDGELALAMEAMEVFNRWKLRAKFRSIEDLIHRLYVCISGVADQLQTNYASDMRNILKSVFLINNLTDLQQALTTSQTSTPPLDTTACVEPQSLEYQPTSNEVIVNEFSVDPNIIAQEALFDSNVYFNLNPEDPATSDYANLQRQQSESDLSSQVRRIALRGTEDTIQSPTAATTTTTTMVVSSNNDTTQQQFLTTEPPIWIPDVEAPKCMSCSSNFTVVKRRHHCRNCGKVFCARCSSNSVPLPKYGHKKPVRVCNKCFMYHLAPFTV